MTYGRRLREDLEATGISVRALAKALNPEKPENAQRQLHRILAPTSLVVPRETTKRAIADAMVAILGGRED